MTGEDFDDFVRTRSTGLLRIAYLLTGDRHAAEDLLQEVLEQMHGRWRRISAAPEAYARRALVNRSTNRWRGRARRPEAALAHHDVPLADHSDGVAVRDVVVATMRYRVGSSDWLPVAGDAALLPAAATTLELRLTDGRTTRVALP